MASGILGFRADVTLVLGDDPWLAKINWWWDRVTVFILFNGFFDLGNSICEGEENFMVFGFCSFLGFFVGLFDSF